MARFRRQQVRLLTLAAAAALTAGPLTSAIAAPTPAPAPPVGQPGGAAGVAGLSAAVAELRRTREAAVQSAEDTEVELTRLDAAQADAGRRLADAEVVLQRQRATNAARIRQLYAAGGELSMFGELLTGGRPDDLIDRAWLASSVAATNTVSSQSAAAAAQEAADAAASIAGLADQQITLATRAGQRAGQLSDALDALSGKLAAARAAAQRAADDRAAQLAATADAGRAAAARRLAQAAETLRSAADMAELETARSAATSALAQARAAGSAGGAHIPVGTVPSVYRAAVQRAGATCPTLSPALLASQLAVESGWNPFAVSSAGAQGLAQFLPGTWLSHGLDGDGDGRASAFHPFDAIVSAAAYDCAVAEMVLGVPGSAGELMLAAYNAGPGAVLRAGGVPAGAARYVATISGRAPAYIGSNGQLR